MKILFAFRSYQSTDCKAFRIRFEKLFDLQAPTRNSKGKLACRDDVVDLYQVGVRIATILTYLML